MREDKRVGIDVSIENARSNFERRAAEYRMGWGVDPMPTRVMEELAGLWVASRPEFAADLHAAVDGPAAIGQPEFSPLTKEQRDRKLGKIQTEIDDRKLELRRREAERDLAVAEERAAAVGLKAGAP